MAERQFGPYRLVHQIAVGGMAEIYLAKTTGIAGFEKFVAVKMIHPNFSEDQSFIQMLIDEAKITVQLQHVNVAQTFDLGRVGNTYYITMEYVDGADLYQMLRRGAEKNLDVPFDVAAYVTKEVATGLDYAHRKKDVHGKPLRIVHRDVSPQNVLVSFAGEIKIVDFGIAKATMRARQTAVGVIKGKYYYMSPEQAWGEPVDRRSDIFSTGILLYEMLTGQMLYLEEDLHKLLDMVRKAEIDPPTVLRRDVPPQLERIVMRALAKKREDRYQSANELATDLERFLHAYSPVFRAPKVASWAAKVLDREEDDDIDETELPRATGKSYGGSLTDEMLVRERSEITDENSVIFRIRDLVPPEPAPPAKPRALDDVTGEVGRPAAFPGARGAGASPSEGGAKNLSALPKLKRPDSRPPDQETRSIGANVDELLGSGDAFEDESDDRTEISSSPAFSAQPGTTGDVTKKASPAVPSRPLSSSSLGEAEERTVVDANFVAAVRDKNSSDSFSDDSPTVERERIQGFRGVEGKNSTARTLVDDGAPSARTPLPFRKPVKTEPPPIPPPAIIASNPQPAISEVRAPRRSRRTPAGGVPSNTGSLLSEIVGQAGRGQGPAGMPFVPRDTQRGNPAGGMSPIGGGPVAHVTPGFDRINEDGTTTPFDASGLPLAGYQNPLPYPAHSGGGSSAFPQGFAPQSLSGQMAALEVDEIPEAFRLSRPSPNKTKLLALIITLVVCVIAGVVLGVVLFSKRGNAAPKTRDIELVSIPVGATVYIDGQKTEARTPTVLKNIKVGTKYVIKMTLADYQPWESEKLVAEDGVGEVKVIGRLEPILVALTVKSTPIGADVVINGTVVGQTPLVLDKRNPKETRYVELRRRGYTPQRKELVWDDVVTQVVDLQLIPSK